MIDSYRYFMPVQVVFGTGALGQLSGACSGLGSRPLIVTGRKSARENGALDRVLNQFPEAKVFDGVEEDPTTETCDQVGAACREHACGFIIAIGGGSPMDVAKAAAGLAMNAGRCADFFGKDQFTRGALPLVTVPTTAGSGSEVTPNAVIVDAGKHEKKTIKGNILFPKAAILDPELTRPLPRSVTVNTGLDALSQAMEGMVSKTDTPVGDTLAIDAIERITEFLPRAAADGNDIEARSNMLHAAMLSGCVIAQSGTTLVHGMGYPLTLEFHIAHGLANGLLLTPLFQHNAHAAPHKVAAIARALGRDCGESGESASRAVAQGLHDLFKRIKVSPAGKHHGFDGAQLAGFAKALASNQYRLRNQIGEVDENAILRWYEQANEGAIV